MVVGGPIPLQQRGKEVGVVRNDDTDGQPAALVGDRDVEIDGPDQWFCRKFPWCASSTRPLGWLTLPANRIAAPDAIRLRPQLTLADQVHEFDTGESRRR